MESRVSPRIVVLGVGNILLGDEGAGVHAVRELERSYTFPPNVDLVDGGTAGLDLLSFVEEAEYLIVIDCVQADSEPGTIFRFVPDDIPPEFSYQSSLHQISLMEVLSLAEFMGKRPETLIVGIQPENVEEHSLELTPAIQRGIPEIIELVLGELHKLGIVARPIRQTGKSPIP